MSDVNAVMALKNAWSGAVAASDRIRDLEPAVLALPGDTVVSALDLETYHRLTLTQANAVMALRGLVEQLKGCTAVPPSGDEA